MEEVLGGLSFFWGQGVDFSDLGSEEVVKIDLMIIGSRWWNMVSSFFGEDQSVVDKFWGKDLLRFRLFCSGGKVGGSGDLGYLFFQWGAFVKETRSTLDDLMEGSVCVHTY